MNVTILGIVEKIRVMGVVHNVGIGKEKVVENLRV